MKKRENKAKITIYVDEKKETELKKYFENKNFQDTNYYSEKPLTEREKTVLKLMMEGKSNVKIAKILNLSPNTIKIYTSKIFQKLNVDDRVQAAVKAVKDNLV